jgi:hypothetical protein
VDIVGGHAIKLRRLDSGTVSFQVYFQSNLWGIVTPLFPSDINFVHSIFSMVFENTPFTRLFFLRSIPELTGTVGALASSAAISRWGNNYSFLFTPSELTRM